MRHTRLHTRWIAAGLAVAMVLVIIAPAAQASGRGDRRYKRTGSHGRVQRVVYGGPRYTEHHSSAAPLLVGLVGGFILGAATAGASDRGACATEVEYRYVDPFCGRSYASVEAYWDSPYRHHHPRVLRVIDTRHDTCVRNIRWDGRRWNDCEDQHWEEWDR